MAVSAAIMLGLFSVLSGQFEHGSDFHGLDSVLAVSTLGLAWNVLVCIPGALAGYYVAQRKRG